MRRIALSTAAVLTLATPAAADPGTLLETLREVHGAWTLRPGNVVHEGRESIARGYLTFEPYGDGVRGSISDGCNGGGFSAMTDGARVGLTFGANGAILADRVEVGQSLVACERTDPETGSYKPIGFDVFALFRPDARWSLGPDGTLRIRSSLGEYIYDPPQSDADGILSGVMKAVRARPGTWTLIAHSGWDDPQSLDVALDLRPVGSGVGVRVWDGCRWGVPTRHHQHRLRSTPREQLDLRAQTVRLDSDDTVTAYHGVLFDAPDCLGLDRNAKGPNPRELDWLISRGATWSLLADGRLRIDIGREHALFAPPG